MPTLTITGKTRVYGTLAHPIDHIRVPSVMNPLYEQHGIDAVMVPIHVLPEDLEDAVRGMRATRNLGGLCVTVPHKVTIAALCDEVGAGGRRVGAVNAVRFDPADADGRRRMIGDNFDGQGYVAGMKAGGFDFAGKHVLQLGAGGAGMAIAFAVAEAGAASLSIANRTVARAEDLAHRVHKAFPGCITRGIEADADPAGYDVVINTTSLGLHAGDPLPVDVDRLDPATVVSEIIMIPEETALLKAARARGHSVHYGRPMLEEQIKLIAAFIGCPFPG
ncbi:shikimate 5-dehydrogenase [Thalassobaculum fulvum]|uniref:shikimate dehydrogenase (NADP(+)) n=1 Tax=Thalassobaculum fulvum TaxID=1633335 RepID=A0A918XS02_9PROT|nr:shikimate dehydrogenase [Thalassobaculum fulvum]GHD47131.1 shikimate 5-dehydrogenase [Thalassobaculum fulvum]